MVRVLRVLLIHEWLYMFWRNCISDPLDCTISLLIHTYPASTYLPTTGAMPEITHIDIDLIGEKAGIMTSPLCSPYEVGRARRCFFCCCFFGGTKFFFGTGRAGKGFFLHSSNGEIIRSFQIEKWRKGWDYSIGGQIFHKKEGECRWVGTDSPKNSPTNPWTINLHQYYWTQSCNYCYFYPEKIYFIWRKYRRVNHSKKFRTVVQKFGKIEKNLRELPGTSAGFLE